MGMLQTKLRRDLPFGKIFHGAEHVHPDVAKCAYYQHGLYFDNRGNLLEDSPLNAQKVALIKSLTRNPEEPEGEVLGPERVPANPEVIAELESKNDDELQAMAVRLKGMLIEQGDTVEFDPEDEEATRDDWVNFIASNAG